MVRQAVTRFLLTTERLCANQSEAFDEEKMTARIAQILSRIQSPASMFNHGKLQTREDWTGRFRDIACPVLVIHGERDPILPPANGRAIAENLPQARFLLLPKTGHELPDAAIPAIAESMAQLIKGKV